MKEKSQISILIQDASSNINWNALGESDLICRLCASLYPKMQHKYDYVLYLGCSGKDIFKDRAGKVEQLRCYMTRHYPRLVLHFYKIPDQYETSVQKWNFLFERAYADGMNYFYQLDAAILLLDQGWEDDFIGQLQAHDDFGVVFPTDIENIGRFLHPFVGRPHYVMFGYYYPPKLSVCANWVEQIYAPHHRYWSRKKIQTHPIRVSQEMDAIHSPPFQQQVVVGRNTIATSERSAIDTSNAKADLVSVVMITRNRAEVLSRAIDSVLHQTHTNFELLVIDDASEDETANVVARYTHSDSRVRYYYLSEQAGPCAARTYGVKLARGDYIALADDDDISYPPRLEWQLHYLQQHKDMAACTCLFHDERYRFLVRPKVTELPMDKTLIRYTKSCPFYLGAYSMFRKAALLACGYRDFFVAAMEDVDLTLRFQERYKVGLLPEYLYIYIGYRRSDRASRVTDYAVRRFFFILAAYISAAMRRSGLPDPIEEGKTILQMLPLVATMPTRKTWAEGICKTIKKHGKQKMTSEDIQHLLTLSQILNLNARLMRACFFYCHGSQKWKLVWLLWRGFLRHNASVNGNSSRRQFT